MLISLVSLSCGNDRVQEVAEKGAIVMPFDLERSTHVFEKIENGGLQQVYSDDEDSEEIALIRAHLSEEAGRFAKGNFESPEAIHGKEMPGLEKMTSHFEDITITYSDIENGGQILYQTEDSTLVVEIHNWFDAQLSDHGSHAQGQHRGH